MGSLIIDSLPSSSLPSQEPHSPDTREMTKMYDVDLNDQQIEELIQNFLSQTPCIHELISDCKEDLSSTASDSGSKKCESIFSIQSAIDHYLYQTFHFVSPSCRLQMICHLVNISPEKYLEVLAVQSTHESDRTELEKCIRVLRLLSGGAQFQKAIADFSRLSPFLEHTLGVQIKNIPPAEEWKYNHNLGNWLGIDVGDLRLWIGLAEMQSDIRKKIPMAEFSKGKE